MIVVLMITKLNWQQLNENKNIFSMPKFRKKKWIVFTCNYILYIYNYNSSCISDYKSYDIMRYKSNLSICSMILNISCFRPHLQDPKMYHNFLQVFLVFFFLFDL